MDRKQKTIAAIAGSALVLVGCLGGLALATYGLFNSEETVENHLEAGELKADLWLVKTTDYVYDAAEGKYVSKVDDEDANISALPVGENSLFDISPILPGSYRQTDLELRNEGDIAFTYDVSFTNIEVEGESSQSLLDQMEITFAIGEEEEVFALSEKTIAVEQPVGVGEISSFSIKALFKEGAENNSAMNGSISFDIKVVATQVLPE